MLHKTTSSDPIACVPSVEAVRKALEQARSRVATLEFLLTIAEGVEARLNGTACAVAAADQRDAHA